MRNNQTFCAIRKFSVANKILRWSPNVEEQWLVQPLVSASTGQGAVPKKYLFCQKNNFCKWIFYGIRLKWAHIRSRLWIKYLVIMVSQNSGGSTPGKEADLTRNQISFPCIYACMKIISLLGGAVVKIITIYEASVFFLISEDQQSDDQWCLKMIIDLPSDHFPGTNIAHFGLEFLLTFFVVMVRFCPHLEKPLLIWWDFVTIVRKIQGKMMADNKYTIIKEIRKYNAKW